MSIDADELKWFAQDLGEQFADCLFADPRWPGCKQLAVLAEAEEIVRAAIDHIADIFVDQSDLVFATMTRAFRDSMPRRPNFSTGRQAARKQKEIKMSNGTISHFDRARDFDIQSSKYSGGGPLK